MAASALPRLFLALPAGSTALRDVLAHQRALLAGVDAAELARPDAADRDHLLAREHWFPSWERAMADADAIVDRRFEAAADAVVDGDLAGLRALLAEDPAIAGARSTYGHHATLLHHVAANGIEEARQWQSPANAPEIAQLLLDAGAEVDAICTPYGHPTTAMTLLLSSAHPAIAGVQPEIAEVLVRGGARIDGLDDDGSPLWTAITAGYAAAVDRLAALGARIDNLVFAAALDDVDAVERFLAAPQLARSAARMCSTGPALDPDRMLEYATIYAAGLGRRRAVERLLADKPDLEFREPLYGATVLSSARYRHPAAGRPDGNPEIVALLERH